MYGTVTRISDDTSIDDFSASFGEFEEPNPNPHNGTVPILMDKIPNAVVVNHYVDTSSPEREETPPISQESPNYEKPVKISMPAERVKGNTYEEI